jgi:ABC-type transporter Mla MlaB component
MPEKDGTWLLMVEELTFLNVKVQLEKWSKIILDTKKLDMDLLNLTKIDTSGIALLLELKKIAKKHNCRLNFINQTEQLKKLCQLYQVTL